MYDSENTLRHFHLTHVPAAVQSDPLVVTIVDTTWMIMTNHNCKSMGLQGRTKGLVSWCGRALWARQWLKDAAAACSRNGAVSLQGHKP